MKVVTLVPAGRFPTVTNDPGPWWGAISGQGAHDLQAFSSNVAWWRALCSQGDSGHAVGALDALREQGTYASAARYIETLTPLGEHLARLNDTQEDISFSLATGAQVLDLNYEDSAALGEYAKERSPLAELVGASLASCPKDIDLLLVNVTMPLDLLTGMIAARILRRQRPKMHTCLASHSYEDTSLTPRIDRLQATGALQKIFDSIIVSDDDRDAILPSLVQAVAAGRPPRGYLTRADLAPAPTGAYVAPVPILTFAPEPIFRMPFQSAQTAGETPLLLDRLAALSAAGYRTVILRSAPLRPALVEALCSGIFSHGLKLRWACACALDTGFARGLFERMREAGCYEAHIDLASLSPKIRQQIGVASIDPAEVESLLSSASAAGVGLHVVLATHAPGQTAADLRASAEFAVRVLSSASNATVWLRPFMPAASINAQDSTRVQTADLAGDLSFGDAYLGSDSQDASDVEDILPEVEEHLVRGLGWDRFGTGAGPSTALHLYFVSGLGAIFKSRPDNPFANPLRTAPVRSQ